MGQGKFDVYKDKKGEWRFNLKAGNGEIIATSEGYRSRGGCLNGILSIKKNASKATIVVEENEIKPRVIKKENKAAILSPKDLEKTIGKVEYSWKVMK